MSDTILFIVEGEDVEPKVLENLWDKFFRHNSNSKIHITFDSNIYLLWNEMKEDEDLEVLEILMERNERNRIVLEEMKDEISEVYLFFDYDGHADEASDDDLEEMISFFDNETEEGKLFLSYPMVEALRHFNPEQINFAELAVEAKKNIHYKNVVHKSAKYFRIENINGAVWNEICFENLCKANSIILGDYQLPASPETVTQESIFSAQRKRYITPDSLVSVLSAFPLFVYHYFGNGVLSRFRK